MKIDQIVDLESEKHLKNKNKREECVNFFQKILKDVIAFFKN